VTSSAMPMCEGRSRGKQRPFTTDDSVDSGGYRARLQSDKYGKNALAVDDGGDGENPQPMLIQGDDVRGDRGKN
jgi:hypothetical protein